MFKRLAGKIPFYARREIQKRIGLAIFIGLLFFKFDCVCVPEEII